MLFLARDKITVDYHQIVQNAIVITMRNFNFQEPEKKVPNLTLSTTDTGEGSYAYSVTQTSKIIKSSGEGVHSTTSNKVCFLLLGNSSPLIV